MPFNDDEQIVIQTAQTAAKERPEAKITRNRFNKPEAGLEEGPFKVLVQLIGGGTSLVRTGLDLIAVLDISGSMVEDPNKIKTMKKATSFVIKKLGQLDRLSVVTFSSGSTKLCPLRQMTENAKQEIDGMVQALSAGGGTNIPDGLTTALKILDGRRLKSDRKPAILLMSDGQTSGDVTTITFPSDVTVHTFGFGVDCDAKLMDGIARRSMGGMFWQAPVDKLTTAFAQCLAGLLTVAAEELELVLIPQDGSIIKKVSAGSYTTTANADGSVSVDLGDLYVKEVRNTIVELLLSKVEKDIPNMPILKYTYKTKDLKSGAIPRSVTIKRSGNARAEEVEEIKAEESRLSTVSYMKNANEMAERKDLTSAQEKVIDGINKLDDEIANAMTEMLKEELEQFLDMIQTEEDYLLKGRAFVLAALTSHNRQRFATRGDNDDIRLFATPRMNEYLQQANDFINNPEKPVPSAEEDIKKEVGKDPLAPFAGALSEYLQTAIEALQGIQSLIKTNA